MFTVLPKYWHKTSCYTGHLVFPSTVITVHRTCGKMFTFKTWVRMPIKQDWSVIKVGSFDPWDLVRHSNDYQCSVAASPLTHSFPKAAHLLVIISTYWCLSYFSFGVGFSTLGTLNMLIINTSIYAYHVHSKLFCILPWPQFIGYYF